MAWKKLGVESVEVEDPKALVYRMEGILTDGDEAYSFLDDFRARVKKGASLIILNLADVEHISSAGVGIIAACLTSAKNGEARLCLAATPKRGQDILKVVGLWGMIDNEESEEAALAKA